MFGFQGGEGAATVERKRSHMKAAQLRWPFLTHYDVSTVSNEVQLGRIVGDRTGRKQPEAQGDVKAWPAGRDVGP